MMKYTKRINRGSMLIAACVLLITLLSAFFSGGAFADEGDLEIDGAIINRIVTPRQTFEHEMTIMVGSESPARDITIEVKGLGQRTDGSYLELSASADNAAISSRDFIKTIEPASFSLKPGSSQVVTVRIEVPADIGNGSRYAVIYIRGVPVQQTGVVMITAIDVPVIITHGTLEIKGEISQLSAENITSGQPITVATMVTNGGNHHFKASNNVTMKNSEGKVLATGKEELTPCSIIPGYSYLFIKKLVTNESVAPGIYTIESYVKMDNGTELTKITTLNLAESYQPTTVPAAETKTRQPKAETTEETGINWSFVLITMGGILFGGLLIVLIARRRSDR